MSVKIIVDSSTDVTPDIKERLTVVPLIIRFGDKEYMDGIDIDHNQFYEKLVECDELPSTSQPSPDAFMKVYEELTARGDTCVVITLSSKLSGTYQSASLAAADYEGKVFVVDSKSVAIGTGILTEVALSLADMGFAAKDIAKVLEEERENLRIIAMLDTLEYLKKGGRISATTAIAGGLLSIKPVVEISDGAVEIIGKARGSKQGNNLLVKEIENSGGVDFSKPILLGYTGLSDALLKKYIEDSAYLWENGVDKLRYTIVGGVIGTHTGPGVVAAAYFKNKA
ncbi:MAG: DegV family protein [Clostridia bacterium]|nr:DegV family protein [Clostridia bacterium]